MFKKAKSLVLIVTTFALFIGGGTFATHAASNIDVDKENKKVTYYVTSDKEFAKFYNKLFTQWGINCEVKYVQKKNKQYNNNKYYVNKERKVNKPEQNVEQPAQPEEQVEEPKNPQQPKQPEQNVEEPKQPTQPKEQIEQPKQPVQPEEKVEQPSQPTEEQPKQEEQKSDQLNDFEWKVFELTNQERVNNGLQPLQVDYELSRVAREKSRDMAVNRYFSHDSPVYGSPFDMMRSYGITYRTAGENIAKGQRTPAEVVNAWMNSPGHRANILNPNFTHIGVGYVEQGNHWTQQFIGK